MFSLLPFPHRSHRLLRHPLPPLFVGGRCGRRCAFTIVELMVVIAIVTLLVAMILPRYGYSRELARRSQCAANCRSQTQACDSYSVSNRGFFPPSMSQSDPTGAYSFDMRSSFVNPKIPLGLGLCASGDKYMVFDPKAFYCPSLNTSGMIPPNTTNYHSMDVNIPNWWNGIGASWWNDPAYAAVRVIIGYSYRAPSWYRTNPASRFINVERKQDPKFVVNVDIMDARFGRRYAHKQGYTFSRIDESTDWRNDEDGEFDQATNYGVAATIDGVNSPALDETLFKRLESGN